jgi:hypothetical protein
MDVGSVVVARLDATSPIGSMCRSRTENSDRAESTWSTESLPAYAPAMGDSSLEELQALRTEPKTAA